MRPIVIIIILSIFFSDHFLSQDSMAKSPKDSVTESNYNLNLCREVVLKEINKYRRENYLEPLEMRDDLNVFAQDHSIEMLGRDAMYHSDLSCDCNYGECVMITYIRGSYEELADQTLEAFMGSSVHHDILMSRKARYVGVGLSVKSELSEPDEIYEAILDNSYTITLVLD